MYFKIVLKVDVESLKEVRNIEKLFVYIEVMNVIIELFRTFPSNTTQKIIILKL